MDITTEPTKAFYRQLASHAGLGFVTLDPSVGDDPERQETNPLAARLLSEEICRHFTMIPVAYGGGVVTIATSTPADEVAQDVAVNLTGRDVRFVVAPEEEILQAIDETFGDWPAGAEASNGHVAAPDERVAHITDPHGSRLGDLLVARGLVSEEQVAYALGIQARTGARLGEILTTEAFLPDSELVAVLAEQFQLPLVDVAEYEPDPAAIAVLPEPLTRHLRIVPIAVDETTLYLALADRLDDQTIATLREHTQLDLRGFLAPRNAIDDLLQRIHGQAYVEVAKSDLLNKFPESCANRVVTTAQKVSLVVFAIVVLVLLVLFPLITTIVIIGACSLFYLATSLYKFRLTYNALGHTIEIDVSDAEVAALDERDLPVYTILVPLYREAGILGQLVSGIGGLDYPKSKLDVRLLCEEDDPETPAAIREMNLPPHFRLVVVPDAQPKTKPKACNYGLLQADGKYVVIYDAEDRPDADQLKKCVIAFGKASAQVTCIQAKLNYFNSDQNLLTRWFTTEYSMWFDLLLPGLDAEGVAIPLGGTSNHFMTDRLIDLAAWDPFNVTEDADLGIRLHVAGYKTAVLDSTTLEEANSELNNWINQRSRWIKGYFQTYLVHMRNPFRLVRQMGIKSFISFQLVIGGTFIFLLNPIFWALTTVFFFTQAGFIEQLFPSFIFYAAAFQLFVGNFVFMYLNVAGSVQRGYFDLAKYALLSPLYWGLMSVAAWKGFLQLFYKPFYWEKTVHGLDAHGGAPAPVAPTAIPAAAPAR